MSHTAWTKAASQRSYGGNGGTHQSSGYTSDLLIPRGGSSRKGKSRLPSEPKKSRDVQKLENLIEAVDSASYQPKYPKEGCFCRARKHALSRYVPLCTHCGLVLCQLQHPALPCPSCRSSLFPQPSTRTSVRARLSAELDAVLKTEEAAREERRTEELQREIESAGGGAFPVLQPSNVSKLNPVTSQPHKVLSLNSKTKKVTLSAASRKNTPPASPGPSVAELAAEEEELEDMVSREERKSCVPPPGFIAEHAQRKGTERRWEPLRGNAAVYVQPRKPTGDNDNVPSGSGQKRKNGKNKASEVSTTAAASIENV